ncbi:oxidative stress survival, Svf1-like protein [Lactarius quietus]|nr:oxidative stress survival, Svf1-like protein [Lactarius quietus]
MFSSFFSSAPPVDPQAPNFLPVSSLFSSDELNGELEPKDLEWKCESGFVTETQIWYSILEDGSSLMCQVIHSSVGVWYPTIQFTFKVFNPRTGENIWRSVNVTNFLTPPPNLDKRSSQADEFTITHKDAPDTEFPNHIRSPPTSTNGRPVGVPGFKIGKGPDGGNSYFGPDAAKPEGYVTSGNITVKGKKLAIESPGMFVHAIQGMRPNLVASRWNFTHFQSLAHGGVSAIQMEFTTTNDYGRKGAGSGYVGVNLAAVTAETKWPNESQPEKAEIISRAQHLKSVHDPDTGYSQPTELLFRWGGPSILPGAAGPIEGTLTVDGLIEKVDVLAEIPSVIKTVVSYVAGTKPYIYQWITPAKLKLAGPNSVLPGLESGLEVEGFAYTEATFISE